MLVLLVPQMWWAGCTQDAAQEPGFFALLVSYFSASPWPMGLREAQLLVDAVQWW
jgi:hypothetical protein